MKTCKGINWFQRRLCRWFCPRFVEEYPEDDDQEIWVAVAMRVNFVRRWEVFTCKVVGRRNAYEVARWLALTLCWVTRSELGVDYGVREPTEYE